MLNNSNSLTTKRGYLKGEFLFSHIIDQKNTDYELHYHEFNKIIILISGNVNYLIEGKSYKLKPWDILLISSNEIHMPVIDPNKPYERIGIWVNSKFLEKHSTDELNLSACFETASKQKNNLLRLNTSQLKKMKKKLSELEKVYKDKNFESNTIKKNSLAIEVITDINRLFLNNEKQKSHMETQYDKNINFILNYINENLKADLSIDKLSDALHVSKYSLMYSFKINTGYTIHNYITQKRLIMANSLIMNGRTIKEAFRESGFNNYSSFARAFRKAYGLSPGQYYKLLVRKQ